MEFNPEILERLANFKMPFGRYGGRLLIDLPESYVCWFQRKGFPPGEVGELLSLLYEVKLNGLEPMIRPLVKKEGQSRSFESQKLPKEFVSPSLNKESL